MSFSISGKTAIVRGAANGIGLAIARHFLDKGANVMFADMDEVRLEDQVGEEVILIDPTGQKPDKTARLLHFEVIEDDTGRREVLHIDIDDAKKLEDVGRTIQTIRATGPQVTATILDQERSYGFQLSTGTGHFVFFTPGRFSLSKRMVWSCLVLLTRNSSPAPRRAPARSWPKA